MIITYWKQFSSVKNYRREWQSKVDRDFAFARPLTALDTLYFLLYKWLSCGRPYSGPFHNTFYFGLEILWREIYR